MEMYKGRSHTKTLVDAEVIQGKTGNPIMTSSGQYILEVVGLGQCPKIEISKEEFLELKSAKQTLREAFACEEKYEIVIHNYIELEKELSGLTIADIVRRHSDYSNFYSNFFNYTFISNIKIANLLSSARLYTDSLPENISNCLQDSNSIKQIKGFLDKEYTNNFYYRFIYELRNYVQHNNLPTHRVSREMRRTEDKLIKHSSHFSVKKKILLEDKRIKRKVLDEMKEEIDLILAIRHYIESISEIHIQARELVKNKVTEARDSIESAIDKYKGVDTIDKESSGGLSIINRNKENEIIEEFSVSLDWDNIRLNLIKKNKQQLTNLYKKYATTQTNLGKNKH